MLSLGTGSLIRPLPYAKARRWGLIHWGFHVLDVVLDGVSDTVDHQAQTLLADRQYLRLQVELKSAKDDMDDAESQNIKDLVGEADRLVAGRHEDLLDFFERLLG